MFLHSLLMQEPKKPQERKSWYRRFIEVIILWKPVIRSPMANSSSTIPSSSDKPKLRKCTSLKVATSFTRVCLCAPVSSYNEAFRTEIPPRRSYSCSRSYNKSFVTPPIDKISNTAISTTRVSVEGRRLFRGKSLSDDVVMRKFVREEAMMHVKRRNQMEFIRKRNATKKRKLGPSPLSRMVMASEDDNC